MGARRAREPRRDAAAPAAIDQLFEGDADPAAPPSEPAPGEPVGDDGKGDATIDLTRED